MWLGHHRRIRPPGLFALYVAGYSGFRIFEETLRVDYSNHIFGLRLNFFVALDALHPRTAVVRRDPAGVDGCPRGSRGFSRAGAPLARQPEAAAAARLSADARSQVLKRA